MSESLRTIDQTIIGELLTLTDDPLQSISVQKYSTKKKLIGFPLLTSCETKNIISNIQTNLLPQPLTTYLQSERQCNRICVIDERFSRLLWFRIKGLIEKTFTSDGLTVRLASSTNGFWEPLKINECMRVCEYPPTSIGFKPHYDIQYNESETIKSMLSVVIYLNDDFEGGETIFYEPVDDVAHPLPGGLTVREEIELNQGIDRYNSTKIKPVSGHCVIFDHSIMHSGAEIKNGTKYIIRTDIIYTVKELSLDRHSTILEKFKFQASLNFFRDAQFSELNGNSTRASELYERSLSHKIHTIPINDTWYLIIPYMNMNEIDRLVKTSKIMKSMIMSKRSSYWASLCQIKQPIAKKWIPGVLAKKGCKTLFIFKDKDFFKKNIVACLRVAAIYSMYLFGNGLMNTASYIGCYDPVTGDVIKCELINLLTCAFYELPVFGKYFNLYSKHMFKHKNLQGNTPQYINLEYVEPMTINNIDEKYIKIQAIGTTPPKVPKNCVDHSLLEMKNYDEYLKSLNTLNGCGFTQIERISDIVASENCFQRGCDSSIKEYTTKIDLTTNNLIFDFSKQKLKIEECNKIDCRLCLQGTSSSLTKSKAYVVNFQELNIPSHMHAGCKHEYMKLSSVNSYRYIGTKYINSLHIIVSMTKKVKVETYYEGSF